MISLVLAASLAAAPGPRAATASTTVVHIPRLDALQSVTSFFDRAGQTAALLRPGVWYAELHPFLSLDPSQPATLRALGIDPAGALTVSVRPTGRITCTQLADATVFQEKAAEALRATARGQAALEPRTAAGITTLSVPRESGAQAGYALKGQTACAFASGGGGFVDDGEGQALLKEVSRLVGKEPKADARLAQLPGALHVMVPERGLVVGLDGGPNELRLEGTSTQLPLPPFQTGTASPYGAMKPEGLLFSRARVAPAGVAQAVGSVRASIQQVCPGCPASETAALARAVAERLTGHMVVLADGVRTRPNLNTAEGRFFATRQALAAEVTDAAAMKAALAPLAKFPGARALEDGWALDVKGGALLVRLRERHLVLGNDVGVTGTLLAALPKEGAKLPHAVDFAVDPKKLASGLNQVSLMDVVANRRLAGIFTLGMEMGPLLARSERLSGWLDSTSGGHRFSSIWTLPATP